MGSRRTEPEPESYGGANWRPDSERFADVLGEPVEFAWDEYAERVRGAERIAIARAIAGALYGGRALGSGQGIDPARDG